MKYESGVYKIINKINGKYYYGSTTSNFNKRYDEHKRTLISNKHSNIHLQAAWNKYGPDAFEFIIIYTCHPNECLLWEQLLLDMWWDGGIYCYNIAKYADAPNKDKALSKEQIENLRYRMIGSGNPFYGKKHSEETKEKLRKAQIGKKASKETKEKMSKSFKGRKHSEETKRKLSEMRKGEKNPMYGIPSPNTGKHHSIEARAKMSAAQIGNKKTLGLKLSKEAKEKIRQARAKLTWDNIRDIREKYKTGNYTLKELGKIYSTSFKNISSIIRNKTWRES